MQIFHGDIVTCDQHGSVYQYLVENCGEIIYVGDDLPGIYRTAAERIELGSRALLPAFGDSHLHFSNWSLFASTFDVRLARSISHLQDIISQYAVENRKTKVIYGYGLSPHSLEEKRLITRTELDQVDKERPLCLVSHDGHSAVANTKAIGFLPYEVRRLRGFDLESGKLENEAFLRAVEYFARQIPSWQFLKSLVAGFDRLAEYGLGLVHAVEGVGFPRDRDLDLLLFLGRSAQAQYRVYPQTMNLEKVLKRKLPRVGGCFACALDGSFGAKDAALIQPYGDGRNPEDCGILFYSDSEVNNFVSKANRAGLQIQLHCIGDAAVIQAVEAIEEALKDYPRLNHRHTLIHATLIPEPLLEKIASLGIVIAVQPAFMHSPLEPLDFLESLLGERVKHIWPLKKMCEHGIMISGGSDGPVTRPDPITGLAAACNHPDPGQSLSIVQALRLFTYNVAYGSFDEEKRGSLEVGKLADLVILNHNPLNLSPEKVSELQVEKLMIAGSEYEYGKKIPALLWESYKKRRRPL